MEVYITIERTAFLAVAVMVLLAALATAPAAARTDLDTLEPGDTVYVGEENLAFGASFGPEPISKLVHFSDPTAGYIDNIIVTSPSFEPTASDVGTTTGTYYAFGPDTATLHPANASGYIVISIPDAMLDVVLSNSRLDSVNGKSVTRNNVLDFKLMNNLAGLPGAAMNIEVTLPGGGVTTHFGGLDLVGIPANGTTAYVGGVSLADAGAGTYTARATWPAASDFYGKGFDSDTVTFEVVVRTLGITASKETITRSNSFVVTITGEPKKEYRLFVREVLGLTPVQYPRIAPGQVGVVNTGSPTDITVVTTLGGTRSIQFNTNTSTSDHTYTVRVEDPADATISDEVRVRVEKGAVTITASGTGTYYMGEEITLSGTNTDNDITYLFLTGPNLGSRGVRLLGNLSSVVNDSAASFVNVDVEADDTWTYRWDTSKITRTLDSGGYTLYAVSAPRDKDNLVNVRYSTATIQLRSPSVTATVSGATVAKGDTLTISGTATGNVDNVYIWIFGKNYDVLQQPVAVEFDSTYKYTLGSGETSDLSAGNYFVIVQHPVNDAIDVRINASGYLEGPGVSPVNLWSLPAPDAADALMAALDGRYVDDAYVNLTFVLGTPWIGIDPVGDQTAGSTFMITGTTNIAAGNMLIVEVIPVAGPTSNSTDAGSVVVAKGDGVNRWSFEVDATGLRPDQYIVTVGSIGTAAIQTATFTVIESQEPPAPGEGLTLLPGWNFVSVPRPLAAGNDTATIFAAVDVDGHSAFRYNTTAGQWVALAATDRIAPLEGFWIYSAGPATVPLNFSIALLLPPSERALSAGWNAVGITGTTPPAARDALLSVDGQWTTLIGFDAQTQAFETGIVNGGSGAYADDRSVYPGRGYWLYMTGPGTLCAVGA